MLHVHQSNRLEALADALCERMRTPVGGALEPELVVVPNAGMARWVSLAVAQRLGIAANLECPFPGAFVARLVQAQFPRYRQAAFDRDVLALRILALWPALAGQDGFAPVRRYLGAPGDRLHAQRAWQLAQRAAQCFDQYQLYRPHWLIDWEAGAGDDWQALLWRALARDGAAADGAAAHRARWFADYLATPADALVRAGLPERVSVFGVAALPPLHLAVLRHLARVCAVEVYFPNPSAAYWGDVQSERTQARARARRGASDAHATQGHPLLASLGAPARDFLDQLLDCDEADWHDAFVPPAADTLLGRLQRDVLDLAAPELAAPAPDDRSIELHVCHSPAREVQVLHDRLLAWFEADPTLEPRDVVVMVPDPETYAPHFAAVFDAAPPQRYIPWSLADRAPAAGQALVAGALALLDLPDTRLTATEVLAWLELPALRAALDLPDEALPVLRRWIVASGARLGYDAPARARAGLPATHDHTWRFGLDRLVLAHATRDVTVGDVAPLPELAAGAPDWAGALAELVHRLDGLSRALAGPHLPARWARQLHDALGALFAPQDAQDHQALTDVRAAIERFAEVTAQAGYSAPLERVVVRAQLAAALGRPGPARAFLTGAVTCCALTPMRAVPFRRVCLLGLNDADFPRRPPLVDFDLMARARQRGDRVAREEDRYLLLEALLAAREAVHLSYVGRGVRDNAPLPPSVVVAELLDVLRAMAGAQAVRALTTEHPLQPFSARYGTPGASGALGTYAAQWFAPARPARPFSDASAPAAPLPAAERLALDELLDTLRHPARTFLRARLDIRLPRPQDEISDEEPFVVGGRDAYDLRAQAVWACLAGADGAAVRAAWRRAGLLPSGAAQTAVFDALWAQAGEFAAQVRPHLAAPLPARDFALTLPGGVSLTGRLDGLTGTALVRHRPAGIKAADALALWAAHLAQCASGDARPALHIGKDDTLTLRPLARDAALGTLAALAGLALRLRAQALAFLPACGWAYARELGQGADPAMRAARTAWTGDSFRNIPGEGDDADVALVFRGRDPLGEPAFAELASEVYGPLLAAAQDRGAGP